MEEGHVCEACASLPSLGGLRGQGWGVAAPVVKCYVEIYGKPQ